MFYLVAGLSSVSVCCGESREEGASSPSWGSSSHSASHLSSSNSSVIWRQMTQRFNVWKLMQTRTKIVFIINAKAEERWPEHSHTASSYCFDISSNKLSNFWSSLLGLSCPLSLKPKAWNKRSTVRELNLSSFIFPQDRHYVVFALIFLIFLPSLCSKANPSATVTVPSPWQPPPSQCCDWLLWNSCMAPCADQGRRMTQHQKLLWVCTSACLSARKVHFPTSRD